MDAPQDWHFNAPAFILKPKRDDFNAGIKTLLWYHPKNAVQRQRQHHKPHFHVYYNGYEASIGIDGELLAGSLPVKQLKLVQAWAAIHEDELYAAWNNAVRNIPFEKIKPLQ